MERSLISVFVKAGVATALSIVASLAVVAGNISSASGAAVTLNADGSFTYNPTASSTLQALASGASRVDPVRS